MGTFVCVVGIGIVCFCIPYIRCFFKRLKLHSKIKKVCRGKGYHLQGTHSFWFLGGKNGNRCDCTIETEEEVFAIKLFGVPRRKRILIFTEKKEFFTRIFAGMLLLIRETFDSNERLVPEYDFAMKSKDAPSNKKLRKILLINPVPMEMLIQADNGKDSKLSPFLMENMTRDNAKV